MSYEYDGGHPEYSADGDKINTRNCKIIELEIQLLRLRQEERADELLREKYPSLNEAWEKYQTLKGLLK